ncbi:MAG TPA: helix-turn-helix transcriptional regulator [Candidatus Corynebacterium avicola]|uniref:Helix-turn-helix transcriptional regulator n=1 Tax=Candidatus Corynebacterium avicola TaxID=2838527 RepID=A0A9D1RSP1_9CORY|nr:helix-turn-helix transcriptional regulator [Candidatus Corynebacterium avicola]
MTTPATSPTWNPAARACPSRTLFAEVGDRWNMLILLALEDGPLRNRDLRSAVDGISDRVLAQRLTALVADGLVARTAFPEIPPRVVYDLTDLGRSALPPIHALFDWTVQSMDDVVSYREEHAE